MVLVLILAGIVLAALAVPASLRARRHAAQRQPGRAVLESVRCLAAIAGAVALFLIATGRPA